MTDVRDGSERNRELVEELAGRLCNWDRWDWYDGVGALNLITPAKRLGYWASPPKRFRVIA